jgi:hypothetical protein
MSTFFKLNKGNINVICSNYKKKKINFFFLNFNYIIYISNNNVNYIKNQLFHYNISSFFLKKNEIKSIFVMPFFSFLNDNKLLCIFINDINIFINIINILENKQFLYSYKNCLSNIVLNSDVLNEYNKYQKNYTFIQFILKKIKIKIIILLLFLLVSLIKYIK